MIVPVTSDLSGYAAFWRQAIAVALLALLALVAPIYLLLYLIYRQLS